MEGSKTNMVKCKICGKEIENEKKVQFVENLWRKFGVTNDVVASQARLCQKCKMEATVAKTMLTNLYLTRNEELELLQITDHKSVYL